jgi:Calcineurin-like phosphoesterase
MRLVLLARVPSLSAALALALSVACGPGADDSQSQSLGGSGPQATGTLVNGGFESGLTGWTATGTVTASTKAHTGGGAAQVGAASGGATSTLAQSFTVPAGGGTLSFWYQGFCNDTVKYAHASATLKDTTAGTTAALLANTCTKTGAWAQVTSAALTAGHVLTFTVSNLSESYQTDYNYTLVDDVTFNGVAPPANDFSLTLSPASATVAPGASASFTVASAVTSGSAETVTLAVSGLPAGVTGTLSPASVRSGAGATLTLAAAASAAGASGTFTVTGTASSGSHTATASLTIAGGSGGGPGTGVGPGGGTVDHLYFAVVGDTRPANIDQTSTYPTAVIKAIYQEIEGLNPRPQFVIGTGDYQYSSTTGSQAQPQLTLYQSARAAYSGTFFPAMGNHECDGYTADNCTSLTQTPNLVAFMSTLLKPMGITEPYYSTPVDAADGSWTAKFLTIACNYWGTAQQAWLASQLATSTTYTILARHEPASANTGPCVSAVEKLMGQHSYDLSLVGHTHTFRFTSGSKEIIVGNGGAPITGTAPFGFATVEKVSGGWQIKQYDYSTGLPVNTFLAP